MTRAACNLILQLATLRHCWRSIQALKAQSSSSAQDSLINNNEPLQDDDDSRTTFHIDARATRDTSLLHLWALLAFHIVYIQTGLEGIFSLLPFYYYMKLILILVTVQPETGFARYWFETFLIPLMYHIHSILDMDWKTFLQKEIILFPYTILSLLFPGIFTLDELLEDQEEEEGEKHHQQLRQCDDSLNRIEIHKDDELMTLHKDGDSAGESQEIPPLHSSTPPIQKKYRFSLESVPLADETNRMEDRLSKDAGSAQRPSSNSKLSEKIRELVVGDKTIRLRDYLFDLNLRTLPSPQHHTSLSTTPSPSKEKTSSPRHTNNRPWSFSKLRNRKAGSSLAASSPEPERPQSRSRRHVEYDDTPSVRRSRRIALLNQNKNL